MLIAKKQSKKGIASIINGIIGVFMIAAASLLFIALSHKYILIGFCAMGGLFLLGFLLFDGVQKFQRAKEVKEHLNQS
jgi:uncharacterized membrane protein YgdD (TMEM256/DUF423 family)